jgi:Ca2+-binding EF-hand superfamily protein
LCASSGGAIGDDGVRRLAPEESRRKRSSDRLPPGLPNNGANYSYWPDSDLLWRTKFKQGTNVIGRTIRTYEAGRELLVSVENKWDGAQVSKYSYESDALGLRKWVIREGPVFATAHHDLWEYNQRNELTDSERYNNTSPPDTSNPDTPYNRWYVYDPIGNRTTSQVGDPADPEDTQYTTNPLNQYRMITVLDTYTGQGLRYDEDGNLIEMFLAGDLDRDGDVDLGDLAELMDSYGKCEGDEGYNPLADINGDGCVNLNDLAELMGLYGSTIGDQIWAQYTWDAENRLIAIEPGAASPGDLTADDKRLELTYDYLGRRSRAT